MKQRPILFNCEMVRAILDGRKTQTRRPVKPISRMGYPEDWCHMIDRDSFYRLAGDYRRFCPYGVPGEQLWVRETWRPAYDDELGTCIEYRAGGSRFKPTDWSPNDGWKCEQECESDDYGKWHPSIYMPRWASRITLDIIDVRVIRVQDITLGQICAEGLAESVYDFKPAQKGFDAWIELWDSINAKRGYGWEENPWVWVVEFQMAETKNDN